MRLALILSSLSVSHNKQSFKMRIYLRTLALALTGLLPVASHATCTGDDIRPTLSLAQQDEIAALVAARPFPTGNHWRATRQGQTITLIGTMHLFDARMPEIVDRLTPTLAATDLLMVEVTDREEQDLQSAIATDPSIAFLTEGPSLIEVVCG